MSATSLLNISDLTYSYGDRVVLDRISLEIYPGKMVALLGPNGSGKSTLMKVVAGLLPAQGKSCSGKIDYLGSDWLKLSSIQKARAIVYLGPDMRADFPMTAREAVLLGRICHATGLLRQFNSDDDKKVEWAMQEALCWNLRDRDISTLSGGERQLVGLARALAQGARLFFLDEALSRMDLNHVAWVAKMLKRRLAEGCSVLLVSHDLHLAAEFADDCILLKDGQEVAKGAPREILTSDHIRKLYPGADLRVNLHPETGTPIITFGEDRK